MSVINLKKDSGVDIKYDREELTSQGGMKFHINNHQVLLEDMVTQLLNEDVNYPEVFYSKYIQLDQDGMFDNMNLRLNFYVMEANLAGVEFVKTKASKLSRYPKILEIYHGGGTVLMQKYSQKKQEMDIISFKVKKGDKFIVPCDYNFTISNSKSNILICGELYASDARHVSRTDSYRGLAYYIIRKNGKTQLVRNPNYREVPKPRKVSLEKLNKKYGISLRTPIIKQVIRKYDKFSWLFEENKLDTI